VGIILQSDKLHSTSICAMRSGHLEPQEVKGRQESVSNHTITWVTLEEENINTQCHETLKCYKRTGWLRQIQLPKKH